MIIGNIHQTTEALFKPKEVKTTRPGRGILQTYVTLSIPAKLRQSAKHPPSVATVTYAPKSFVPLYGFAKGFIHVKQWLYSSRREV